MWNEYAREKIEMFERERRKPRTLDAAAQSVRESSIRTMVRSIGRRMRMLGESIERWGAHADEAGAR